MEQSAGKRAANGGYRSASRAMSSTEIARSRTPAPLITSAGSLLEKCANPGDHFIIGWNLQLARSSRAHSARTASAPSYPVRPCGR